MHHNTTTKSPKVKNTHQKLSQTQTKRSSTTSIKKQKPLQTKSQRRFSTSKVKKPPYDTSTVQHSRLLESHDDFDIQFALTTIPLLSPVSYVPTPTTVPTQTNTTALPEPISNQNQSVESTMVQHLEESLALKLSVFVDNAAFRVPDIPAERHAQVDGRMKRTFVQYTPEIINEQGAVTDVEASESFLLPIIRVGPTPFALMQLRAPTARTAHLRMLGGSVRDQFSGSVENALHCTDNQTNDLFHRALHNLTRSISPDLSDEYQLKAMRDNNIEVNSAGELIKYMTKYDPGFLNLRFSQNVHSFNTVFDTRTPPIGKPRQKYYSKISQPNSFGRIVASQVNWTHLPIDHSVNVDTDFGELLKDEKNAMPYIMPGFQDPNVTNIPMEKKSKSMVHVLDMGQLLPDEATSNLLDPAQVPNLKGAFLYPQLFSHYNSSHELRNLATLLFSSSNQPMSQLVTQLSQQWMIRKLSHYASTADTLAPYPTSHAALIATLNALQSPQQPIPEEALSSTQKLTKFLLQSKSFNFKNIFGPKLSEIESIDPRLFLWLLPILYHFDKPAGVHILSNGQGTPYIDFAVKDHPLHRFQATSLHWVPLNEITRVDPLLAPRWNHASSLNLLTAGKLLTQEQQTNLLSDAYNTTRPDLVNAHTAWSKYLVSIARAEREVLSIIGGGTTNSTAVNDFGQLLTTSTGTIYPTRQSHLNLLHTDAMNGYLNDIILKTRQDGFDKVIGGEAKIVKRFQKYPQMARDFGYSVDEMKKILQK